MSPISQATRRTFLLIACQVVFLALGVWIHGRFLAASANWSQTDQADAELAALAVQLRTNVTGVSRNPMEFGSQYEALLVNREWQIVETFYSADRRDQHDWQCGSRVTWNADDRKVSPLKPVAGTLATPAGPRRAAACLTADGSGYVIVHQQAALPNVAHLISPALPVAWLLTVTWIALLQGVITYLTLSRIGAEESRNRSKADEKQLQRSKDLVRTRDAIIFGLAKLAESRDTDTGQHLERISLYCTRLATTLRSNPKFRDQVTPAFVRLIALSSALHDIGKVGIRDDVLLKQGPLTDDERAHIQEHTSIGGECLEEIERRLGTSNFLQMAREIALSHHEHWSGKGYPNGLSEEQIPLAARIVAIADVYDALSSKRVYKAAMPHDECVELIRNQAGKHFDPDLVKVFLRIESQFKAIAHKYAVAGGSARFAAPVSPEFVLWQEEEQDELLVVTA